MLLAQAVALTLTLQCDGITRWAGGLPVVERTIVEIVDGKARIQPPASLGPNLAGGGQDGWRELRDLVITDREIQGRFSYNWINAPLVIINRMTGDIEIRAGDLVAGQANFRGDCQRASETQLF